MHVCLLLHVFVRFVFGCVLVTFIEVSSFSFVFHMFSFSCCVFGLFCFLFVINLLIMLCVLIRCCSLSFGFVHFLVLLFVFYVLLVGFVRFCVFICVVCFDSLLCAFSCLLPFVHLFFAVCLVESALTPLCSCDGL